MVMIDPAGNIFANILYFLHEERLKLIRGSAVGTNGKNWK